VKCSWNRPILEGTGPIWTPRPPLPLYFGGGVGFGRRVKKWRDDSIPVLTGFRLSSQAEPIHVENIPQGIGCEKW
jgi:hypothetical protein